MGTETIVLVPGILSWWMAVSRSLEEAFVGVYLPVLLLIPDYFRLPIDGLPDPSFSQCTILPIGIGLCWSAIAKGRWKVSAMDFVVSAFVGWALISDFYNVGYKDAQNMLFDMGTLAVFPYMCGKALIEPTGFRAWFARRFVWMLFLVSIISIYEFRMASSLIRPLLQHFFPEQNSGGWFTQVRWGFGRVAGPYGSAILMGTILAMAFLLHRWLARYGQWEPKFSKFHPVPFSKVRTLSAGLLIGMAMTLSRGPWLGLLCGLVVASIGMAVNRKRALVRAAILLVVAGLAIYFGGKAYVDGGGAGDASEDQASAAYRAILIDQYHDIAMQRPIWGWGRGNWPQVPGMKSIDNCYLLVALDHGFVGMGLFIAMLGAALVRLFSSGFLTQHMAAPERAFRFTLLGVIAAVATSLGTVYLGSQLYPLLFLFVGWSEACAIFQPAPAEARAPEAAAAAFGWMRVVA